MQQQSPAISHGPVVSLDHLLKSLMCKQWMIKPELRKGQNEIENEPDSSVSELDSSVSELDSSASEFDEEAN